MQSLMLSSIFLFNVAPRIAKPRVSLSQCSSPPDRCALLSIILHIVLAIWHHFFLEVRLVHTWYTLVTSSPTCCNSPRKCMLVKSARQEAGFPIFTWTTTLFQGDMWCRTHCNTDWVKMHLEWGKMQLIWVEQIGYFFLLSAIII